MRTLIILSTVAIAVATAVWFDSRSSARELQAELDALRAQRRELLALEAQRARLHQSIAEIQAESVLQKTARETPVVQPVPAAAPFALGEWTPYASWSNTGRATPRAALETALWAAAGGDALAMQSLLEIDPSTRNKAESVLERLSPAGRSSYVTPEALIANVTMKLIPLTQAQVAWYHESDDDDAAIGVLFGPAEGSPSDVAILPAGKQDNSPPSLSDNRTSKIALLALHRSSSGWRLVVPASAVDRIAAEMGVPKN